MPSADTARQRRFTRRLMFRKCDGICQSCKTRPATVIHHKDKRGWEGPRGYDMTNLEALCRSCHNDAHTQEHRFRQYI